MFFSGSKKIRFSSFLLFSRMKKCFLSNYFDLQHTFTSCWFFVAKIHVELNVNGLQFSATCFRLTSVNFAFPLILCDVGWAGTIHSQRLHPEHVRFHRRLRRHLLRLRDDPSRKLGGVCSNNRPRHHHRLQHHQLRFPLLAQQVYFNSTCLFDKTVKF